MTIKAIVHVRLPEEGSPSLRVTEAEVLGNGVYKLLIPEDYDAEDEVWEFLPGSVVRCIEKKNFDEKILVAVEKVS